MSVGSLRDSGWTLFPLVDAEIDDVMTWFPDADSVNIWGAERKSNLFRQVFGVESRFVWASDPEMPTGATPTESQSTKESNVDQNFLYDYTDQTF